MLLIKQGVNKMSKKSSTLKQTLAWIGFAVVTTATVVIGAVAYIAIKENGAFLDGVEAHADQCG